MDYGIATLSVIPMRAGASEKSEMVSQVLFGETIEIIERKGRQWCRVRSTWDDYLGWVNAAQITEIAEKQFAECQKSVAYALELMQPAVAHEHFLPLTLGASLPNFDGLQFRIKNKRYQYSGQVIQPELIKPSIDLLIKVARRYLYAPYLWGGRSPFGIDCSGFTQQVYRMATNIALPRDAYQQVEMGAIVDFIDEAQAGDLAFFENQRGRITHVGILLPESMIIHASGQVRIDKIDHFGIFNSDKNAYSHRLRVIKRVLNADSMLPVLTKTVLSGK